VLSTSRWSLRLLTGIALGGILAADAARLGADEIVHVSRGSRWRFLPAIEDPGGEAGSWRQPDFDDSAWELLLAPLGYADGPFGTDLAERDPPMRGSYVGVYLRREFQVESLAEVFELHVNADYDDGFALWINGVPAIRENVRGEPADPINFETRARRGRESGNYQTFVIENPREMLVVGRNVVAVQGLNVSMSSNDFKIDVELIDPFGPDETAPGIRFTAPGRGTTVRGLSAVRIAFDEPVAGVDATDLLINGVPAAALDGSEAGPYMFSFDDVAPGEVAVTFAANHGIRDLALAVNAFEGDSWTYTVDPDAPPADLDINEILASNLNIPLEGSTRTSDWIEIVNGGDEPADLGGWSLSDDPLDEDKWVFPNIVLGPGEYLVVVASGANLTEPDGSGRLHTSFRLDLDGEFLGLYSANVPRELVSAFDPTYPPQRPDLSWGTGADGRRLYFEEPTPGSPNSEGAAYSGLTQAPCASHERGFHNTPFELTLRSPTPDASVRYTLDGTWPTASEGLLYEGPIGIAGTADRGVITVRAVAYRDGFLPSRVSTFSYLFPEHVLAQPRRPTGWPTVWGNGSTTAADYEMDPQVLDTEEVVSRATEGLVSIPTLSIVMDPEDFLGRTRGIYANGSQSGIRWERACSAEFINGDGKEGVQIDCGLRIQGGSSTNNWKSPKLSMRLLFKGDYGSTKLNYSVFPDWPVSRFDTLVLDAGLNLVLSHPDHGQRVQLQYVRDQVVSDLQILTGNLGPQGRFMNLYVNGLYWGLYNVHEKPDASFLSEHYGGPKSEWDAARHSGTQMVDGTPNAWGAMIAAVRQVGADGDRLLALGQQLDLPGHVDYMICNFYTGNTDWAHHNWYASHRRAPGGIFRFHSWDAEHTFKSPNENSTTRNDSNSPTEIFQRLRTNPDYRLLVADRIAKHFGPGGILWVDPENRAWDPESPQNNRPAARYMDRIREIDTAIILECARWGDNRRATPYTRDREWMAELNRLLRTYFPGRSQTVLTQLNRLRVVSEIPTADLSLEAGEVDIDSSLEITTTGEGTILVTVDGSDPRVPVSGEVSASAFEYAGPISLDGPRIRIKARVLENTTWSALTEATFYVPELLADLRVTEIMYNPPADQALEFLEIRNVGAGPFDLRGVRATRGVEIELVDNALLDSGEMMVLVADEEAFASAYPGVAIAGQYEGRLANEGDRITLEDGEGHMILDVAYDDEGLWPLGPDGFGFSLVPRTGDLDPHDPESWRASAGAFGSPGRVDPAPSTGRVLINEVLTASTSPLEDAVELFNPTASDIDVGGWFLSDDRDNFEALKKFRIPDGAVIPAGGHLVVYEGEFNAAPATARSFSLDSAGDQVYLSSSNATRDLTGHIVGIDVRAAKEGVSFGRLRTSAGVDFAPLRRRSFGADSPASLEEFRTGAGLPNSPALVGPVVINEVHFHPADGDHEFVELHNPGDAEISLHDEAGGRGWQLRGLSRRGADGPFEFPPGASIPAGGYVVVVASDPAYYREVFDVGESADVVGPSGGSLDNGGERLTLLEPSVQEDGEVAFVEIDRVRYDDDGQWPNSADGDGPSLERVSATSHGNEPENWAASRTLGGTPGARNSVSATTGNVAPIAEFTASPASGIVPFEVTFDASLSSDVDGSIAGHDWDLGDGATSSESRVTHLFETAGEHEVTLRVTDDDGAVDSFHMLIVASDVTTPGGIRPGDDNSDGEVTIADAVSLLNRLFQGSAMPLPCEGLLNESGNLAVLDVNGDADVNITDAVHLLRYLFQGGLEPVLGGECIRLEGCSEMCRL